MNCDFCYFIKHICLFIYAYLSNLTVPYFLLGIPDCPETAGSLRVELRSILPSFVEILVGFSRFGSSNETLIFAE